MDGGAHGDAECFGLFCPGDDAAVVVGEDDDGAVFEVGAVHAFAGGVEAVAVNECVHG